MHTHRLAKCGHLAPYISGPQKRLCLTCAAPKPRACRRCGADISQRHPSASFCSDSCRLIAAGRRPALPALSRVCALEECDVEFTPRSDRERCCHRRHGVLLANREARARRKALLT